MHRKGMQTLTEMLKVQISKFATFFRARESYLNLLEQQMQENYDKYRHHSTSSSPLKKLGQVFFSTAFLFYFVWAFELNLNFMVSKIVV